MKRMINPIASSYNCHKYGDDISLLTKFYRGGLISKKQLVRAARKKGHTEEEIKGFATKIPQAELDEIIQQSKEA